MEWEQMYIMDRLNNAIKDLIGKEKSVEDNRMATGLERSIVTQNPTCSMTAGVKQADNSTKVKPLKVIDIEEDGCEKANICRAWQGDSEI